MRVIKRDGREVDFDAGRIRRAIESANGVMAEKERLTAENLASIVGRVTEKCAETGRAMGVEEIQDAVVYELATAGYVKLMCEYSKYRYEHEMLRRQNSTDAKILSLLRHDSEVAKQENANKDPVINSTMRDYVASEVSEDICGRYIFPEDVIRAHDEGIIHVHDMGYVSGPITNCELVNLEDMLQNGTVITNTLIEKPHSFRTACNIATQIIAQVASNTYGGQTISLGHLAPFVDISRKRYRKEVSGEFPGLSIEEVNVVAEKRLREEVKDGVQTIQYQVLTLLTSNG